MSKIKNGELDQYGIGGKSQRGLIWKKASYAVLYDRRVYAKQN